MPPLPRHRTALARPPGRRLPAPLSLLAALIAISPAVAAPPAAAGPDAPTAATTTSVATPLSLLASADAYVVQEQPTVNFGTALKLTAANWTTWHSQSYLRFVLPPDAQHRPVVAARVEVTMQRLDQQPSRVELRSVSGSWNETVTYSTRPAVGAVVAQFTLPGQGTTAMSFDVTATVRSAGQYDFAMTNPTAESVASIYAREHGADGPRLVVEYGPGPLCGASFTAESGETYQEALAREDGYFNGLETVRVFYPGLPQAWPGKLDTGGRPMIISFKATPSEVLAGTHDARLRDWFQTAPRDRDTFWAYYHEPEDNIAAGSFTAAQYRAAWQRISGLADQAANPRLRSTLILMGWSLEAASGRNWLDYYPGAAYIDVLGWDLYNPSWRDGRYKPVVDLFSKVIATSQSAGKPFGIAETGSPLVAGDGGGTVRGAWLRDMVAHLSESGALFVAYFDLDWTDQAGIDYRLRDAPSMAAWRDFCS